MFHPYANNNICFVFIIPIPTPNFYLNICEKDNNKIYAKKKEKMSHILSYGYTGGYRKKYRNIHFSL